METRRKARERKRASPHPRRNNPARSFKEGSMKHAAPAAHGPVVVRDSDPDDARDTVVWIRDASINIGYSDDGHPMYVSIFDPNASDGNFISVTFDPAEVES